MGYSRQGFVDFGDPLTAEQLHKIEEAIIINEQAISNLQLGLTGYELLGTTPITTDAVYPSLKIVTSEPIDFTLTSPTTWNFETASTSPTYTKCTYSRDEDKHVITSDESDVANWHAAYMLIIVDNLVVGQEYKIISPIEERLIAAYENGEINLCSYGVLSETNATLVGTQFLGNTAGRDWETFTATETTAKIRVYPNFTSSETFTGVSAVFQNFVIKRADSDDEIGDIATITGSTDTVVTISNVPKYYLVEATSEAEVYIPSTGDIDAGGNSASYVGPLLNKNIVVFGDSIMGMYRGEGSVCWNISQRSGATVYNAGCGGCRMSATHPSDSFNAWSLPSLVDSVVSQDFSYQENSEPGVSYFTEVTTTLQSLDFADIDIVLIHYGTNDFTGDVVLDDSENLLDTSTCCGGLRYSIEKLLTRFQHLSIIVSLPCYRLVTNDEDVKVPVETVTNEYGQSLEEYNEGIKSAARSYNLKTIDSYHELGVNSINHATYLADGTHHNLYGRKRLGEFISEELY